MGVSLTVLLTVRCLKRCASECEQLNEIVFIFYFNFGSRYSKEEGLEPGSEPMMRYQYLLVSAVDYAHYVESHDVVAKAKGFSKLVLSGNSFPVRQVLEDKVLVLQRRRRPEPS